MKRWIRVGCALLSAALATTAASAQLTAVRADSTRTPPLGYYEYLPAGYTGGTEEWPVVIFLHGIGERGNGTTELIKVLNTGLPDDIEKGTQHPFVMIAPQSPTTAGSWNVASIDAMVEYVKNEYRVDLDRIYMTGLSYGGGGVWNYAKAHADKLAAILPICGATTTPNGAALVDLPTWAFHAWGDNRTGAPSSGSVNWVNAIASAISGSPSDVIANYPGTYTGPPGPNQTADADRTASFDAATETWIWQNGVAAVSGSHPILTLYWNTDHDSWTRTYHNQTAWNWLLAQSRNASPQDLQLITPAGAGKASDSLYFPMQLAFDAQPTLNSSDDPVGGTGGSDAPYYQSRTGYIDFGPEWYKTRIVETWTRYRVSSLGNQTPYAEVWWDDDVDSLNDNGFPSGVNFNTAQNLNTGTQEPWIRDRDFSLTVAIPRARYLLLRSPANMTNRAKEYAIIGYIDPNATP